MKSLLALVVLVLIQVVEVQSACNSTHPLEIPVEAVYKLGEHQWPDIGYLYTPRDDLPKNESNIFLPVCLFTKNLTLLAQCGNTTSLDQYRLTEGRDYYYFLAIDNLGLVDAVKQYNIGLAFRSADNICGLDLQPILEMKKPRVDDAYDRNYHIVTAGDNVENLIADGYNVTGRIVGYSLRCEDNVQYQTVCIKDPTQTTKVTTKKTTPKPCTGQWSNWAWAAGSKCSDTCGNCGKRARTRTCLTCGCTGAAKDTVPCGDVVCIYPRKSCCAPYVKKVDKTRNLFVCG